MFLHCSIEIVCSNWRPYSGKRYESEKLLYHYIKSVDKLRKIFFSLCAYTSEWSEMNWIVQEKNKTLFFCHMHIIQIISKTKTKWSIYIHRPSAVLIYCLFICAQTVLISQLAHEAIMNIVILYICTIMCDNVIKLCT